jgi:polar amino acid transport system permease protein
MDFGGSLPAPFDLLPQLLPGALVTVQITALSLVVGLVMAFVSGLAKLSRWRPVAMVAKIYIEVFRGSSALVQVFFFFFVLPLFGLRLGPLEAGVLALGLNTGAYGAEIVRSAILSVDPGQREAAVALNMSASLTLRRVVLPQAIVAMLPPFGNLTIELMKFTSLVSFVTLAELTFQGKILFQTIGRREEIYAMVLLLYFLLAIPITVVTRWLERRFGNSLMMPRIS